MSSIGGPGGPKRPNNTNKPETSSREIKVKRQKTPAAESKTPTAETQEANSAEALFANIRSGKLEANPKDSQNHTLDTQELITEIEKFGFPLAAALQGSPKTTAHALNIKAIEGNNAFQKGVLQSISGPKPAGLIGTPRTVRVQ